MTISRVRQLIFTAIVVRDMLNMCSKRYVIVNAAIVGEVIHIFVAWAKKN